VFLEEIYFSKAGTREFLQLVQHHLPVEDCISAVRVPLVDTSDGMPEAGILRFQYGKGEQECLRMARCENCGKSFAQ